MENIVYDVPISEVAKILDKSDRQVRRYVKEKRLNAKAIRIDGHIKLMFNRDVVEAFKERSHQEVSEGKPDNGKIIDAEVIDSSEAITDSFLEDSGNGDSKAVKYVIDALREELRELRGENRELHYQLEQRSGQVGFLQGKVETLQEEIKMLAPVTIPVDAPVPKKRWWRVFSRS